MFDSDKTGRRAFLGTTVGALLGLSGCTSITDQLGGQTSTNDSTRKTTTETETKAETGTETKSGTTHSEDGNSTDRSSLLYATDEKTGYGIDLQGNPVMGSPDAPVDIYYWSDYQCPFCKKFEQETLPKLIEDYVQPGTVRIVVLDLPYLGSDSTTAARMAKCVWRRVRDEDPDAFKRWHAAVFDEQGKENSGWASKANLLEITQSVKGVDADAVDSCLQNQTKEIKSSINADVSAADTSDIRGTPGFIFYNRKSDESRKIIGGQPYPLFEKAIRKTQNA
ncbi:DsbA family protein [Haladaptatus sp. NG-SE-30]